MVFFIVINVILQSEKFQEYTPEAEKKYIDHR